MLIWKIHLLIIDSYKVYSEISDNHDYENYDIQNKNDSFENRQWDLHISKQPLIFEQLDDSGKFDLLTVKQKQEVVNMAVDFYLENTLPEDMWYHGLDNRLNSMNYRIPSEFSHIKEDFDQKRDQDLHFSFK